MESRRVSAEIRHIATRILYDVPKRWDTGIYHRVSEQNRIATTCNLGNVGGRDEVLTYKT